MDFVTATLHPTHLMRNNARLAGVVLHDLDRAVRLARRTWRPTWDESFFVIRPTAKQVVRTLAAMKGRRVAYDVETDGAHPLECSLRCASFYDGRVAINIPLLHRPGDTEEVLLPGRKKPVTRRKWLRYYSAADEARIIKALRRLVREAACFDTQNGQFDRSVLESQLGVTFPDARPPNLDTILAHHIVASYLPHGLGFLASLYTEAPYYKTNDDGESWASESDDELYWYCNRDVVVTYLAATKLREELQQRPEDVILYAHDAWQEAQAQRWTKTGIKVDLEALEYFQWRYRGLAHRALTAMQQLVAKRVGESTLAHDNPEALEQLLARLLESGEEDATEEDAAACFNPGSLLQLRMLLQHLGIQLTELTATGQVSTAKEFLLAARKDLVERKVPADDDRLAFLDFLFAWREAAKVVGTYLNPEILSDGKIHPSFKVHVVPGGRLCIAGWTPIRTARGVVPLIEVRVGDFVWTHKRRWRPVTAVHHQGRKEVLDVRLSSGYVVTATIDHRVLASDGQWVTIGELRERLKKLGRPVAESRGGCRTLPRLQAAYDSSHREKVGDDLPERAGSSTCRVGPRGFRSAGGASVLCLENGREEPHARQNDGEAPPMEGGMCRWPWVLDVPVAGEASVRSQHRDDESAQGDDVAQRDSRSSYRWQHQEQCTGQFGARDGARTPDHPLLASEGQPCCDVEEVVPRGSVETYDLTVDEDESFEAAGIFSHNSSAGPNFQNQPAEIRGMFVADEGYTLVFGDWDALEMRLGAFLSQDPVFKRVFAEYDAGTGPKPHVVNMASIFSLPATSEAAEKHPGCYRAAKVFAYACCVKTTPVALLSGGSKPISRVRPGDWTWCWDGVRYIPTKVKRVWKTGERECVRITMGAGPNGGGPKKTLTVTPDHLIMRRDGSFTPAGELKLGDRLMPFRRWTLPATGYSLIDPMNTGARVPEHRYVLGVTDPTVHCHHLNGKRNDNRLVNLRRLTREEHDIEHVDVRRAAVGKTNKKLWSKANKAETNARLSAARVASPIWRAAATQVMDSVRPLAVAAKKAKQAAKRCRGCGEGLHMAKGLCKRCYHRAYNKLYPRKHRNHVVLSVEPVGVHEVWDMEVDHPAHNFAVADSVFIHNCAYGAGELTVFESVRAEMPDMDFPTFQVCYSRYKKLYAKLFEFQQQVVQAGTRHGKLDTAVLKRRSYYYERVFGEDSPEASRMQNFPYQGAGADVVSLANRRVVEGVVGPARLGKGACALRPGEVLEQLAQIHDELLFLVPERLKVAFMADFKRLAELPPGEGDDPLYALRPLAAWRLPVDVKSRRRWKPVQHRCDKCQLMVDIEPVQREKGRTTWGGQCGCGHRQVVVVPRLGEKPLDEKPTVP